MPQHSLVIVESGAKAKTVARYLNAAPELRDHAPFVTLACFGHVLDLAPDDGAVNTATWKIKYVPVQKSKVALAKILQAADNSKCIFLASDPDREGATISAHLSDILRKALGRKTPPMHRIAFSEITPAALVHAVLNPGTIDTPLVEAQEARRVLDRLVGYKLSPLLWQRFANNKLSAGRVQSVALCLVADRCKEAREFAPSCFWSIEGTFEAPIGEPFKTMAFKGTGQAAVTDADSLKAILGSLADDAEWVASFSAHTIHQMPPPPFTTSTLQQEAHGSLRLSPKQCMSIAQDLYEAGIITYMRTDSKHIAPDAQQMVLKHINDVHGEHMMARRKYTNSSSTPHAQEAHEAIRPTTMDIGRAFTNSDARWTSAHRKLFELIWRRTLACQMAPAEFKEVRVTVRPTGAADPADGLVFKGSARILLHKGFLEVHKPEVVVRPEDLKAWQGLLQLGKTPVTPKRFMGVADVTRPPALYTEASLIKALEKYGIGRPSTFASITEKLFDKGYVVKGRSLTKSYPVKHHVLDLPGLIHHTQETKLLGGDVGCLLATDLGVAIAEYLASIAPTLMQVSFTSRMEGALDAIAAGRMTKEAVLTSFWTDFEQLLKKATAVLPPTPASGGGSSKVIKEFPDNATQIVSTRFGPALYDCTTRKFTNVLPLMEWKRKTADAITLQDARFLQSLPITMADGLEVHMGKHGLYIKKHRVNHRLPQVWWDKVYANTARAADIEAVIAANMPQRHSGNRARCTSRTSKAASA